MVEKKGLKAHMSRRIKWLCKTIRPHRCSWNIIKGKDLILYLLPKPVVLRQKMPHATMMLWVLPNSNSRLIVKPELSSTRWRIAQFRHKIPKPDSIRPSLISSNVLSLCSRLFHNRLSFTAPVNQISTNENSVAACGACCVYIPSIVCIRENLETCSIGTRTIAKYKVLCRSQVLEDMLHLLPMSLAWIRIKATQSSHCKGDVRTCTNR